MRCEDFAARLNDRLDRRENPADDSQLAAHARECAECESMLHDWLRIGRAFAVGASAVGASAVGASAVGASAVGASEANPRIAEPATRGAVRRRQPRSWSLAAAGLWLAATLLGGLWYSGGGGEREPAVAIDSTAPVPPLDFQQIRLRVGQPEWWGSVVRAAWEPVDPLAEGFRPLTDSFQTAFELLTPPARTATGIQSGLPEDANVSLPGDPRRVV